MYVSVLPYGQKVKLDTHTIQFSNLARLVKFTEINIGKF